MEKIDFKQLLGGYTPKTCADSTDVINCLFRLSVSPQTDKVKELVEQFYKRYCELKRKEESTDFNPFLTELDRERWTAVSTFYKTHFFGIETETDV